MLTLAINTATNLNSVSIFSTEEVLAEKNWQAEQNQAETLIPTIKELLKSIAGDKKFVPGDRLPRKTASERQVDFAAPWQSLAQILVVMGPGPFTSLRVGVITANTLAYSLKIPIYAVSTFDYYKKRLPQQPDSHNNAQLFVSAGKKYAYFEDEKETISIEEVPQNATIYGNILPEQEEILSAKIIKEEELKGFGESFKNEDFSQWKTQKQIEPLYIQPAKITMSPKITGN